MQTKKSSTRTRRVSWRQLVNFLHGGQPRPNSINFVASLEEQDIPAALHTLTPRMTKTFCVGMSKSVLMQSNYDNQGLPLGIMNVYNDGLPPQAPKMLEDIVALVFCIYGGANCNIVGEGPLYFRSGRYYFTRVKNDHNECNFFPGLSAYYYVLLPPWLVDQLLAQDRFRYSGVLLALHEATVHNKTMLIDMPHQVITAEMGVLLDQLRRLPVQDSGLEQAIFKKSVALVEAAVAQAGRGNAHTPAVSTVFETLYAEAEQGYRQQLRLEALRAWWPDWVLAGWQWVMERVGRLG